MKKYLWISLIAVLVAGLTIAFKFAEKAENALEIGAKAPKIDLQMADVSGVQVSLKSAAGQNGLLVIFSCNTCPFVIGNGEKSIGWEGRYPELVALATSKGIGSVFVNSNEAKRDAGDSLEDMKKRYEEQGLAGYYVLDKDHVLADAFGALTTPHVYLFDRDMKLIYKGAIDDAVSDPTAVKEPYLKNAIEAYSAGKPVNPNSTRELGCSIKRVKA
jgi:peroxiredoxin